MSDPSSTSSPAQFSACDYRVERELAAGQTWLAVASSGRRVVLKVLESDCLMGNQLHPMVRDRLGRVRELAHLGVAHLHGVERHNGQVLLVWEFVEGVPLDEFLSAGARSETSLATIAHDLVVAVQSLHALGIVHGAIHGHNVIIRPDRSLCLTHISPLLYNDPDVDMESLRPLLEQMHYASGFPDVPESMQAEQMNSGRESEGESALVRRRALLSALLVAILGGIIALSLWYLASQASEGTPLGEPQSSVNLPQIIMPGVVA